MISWVPLEATAADRWFLHFKQHDEVGPEPLEDDPIPQNNN